MSSTPPSQRGATRGATTADTPKPTLEIKSRLVLLGESAVGKTSLVIQFVNGQFNDHQESTIGGESVAAVVTTPSCHGNHDEFPW